MEGSDHLLEAISALTDTAEHLGDVLSRYQQANREFAERLSNRETVLDAIDSFVVGTMRRPRELTEALEEFEAARHKVRLTMIALAVSQGTTMSELGRRLDLSRQLMSRLAAEAAKTE